MVIALINLRRRDLMDSFPSLHIDFSRAIVCVAIAILDLISVIEAPRYLKACTSPN